MEERCSMPKCPNCGQDTVRTEDWACQWCGYPILSGAYKKIPKTYKQLKEERPYKQKSPVTREPIPEPESEPMPEPAPEPRAKSEPEPTSTAMEVTVDELISAYATDEATADETFGNKLLKVTGIVDRIEVEDYLDFDYIVLTNAENNLLQHVRCFFDKKHGPELNQLTTGQEVTVQGTYDGSIVNIRLRDCVLVT
jgi:DNA-directed RNA polymerase subunit RPC12/RpoP